MYFSPETRRKMSEAKKGKPSNNKGGYHFSKEVVEQIRQRMLGSKNHQWKGDNIGYRTIHYRIINKYGKASCCENTICVYPRLNLHTKKIMKNPKRYEWANINGKYKLKRSDWIQLCPSCHRRYDYKGGNSKQTYG